MVSGDGKPYQLAKSQDSGVLILRNASTGREVRRFGPIAGVITSVAFSPDGKTIATGSGYYAEAPNGQGTVTLWDAGTGRALFERTERQIVALCVAFSPDGSLLVAGHGLYGSNHWPGRLKAWETALGKEVLSTSTPPGSVNGLAFSPDGKTLALAGSGVVELWQVRPFTKLRELKGHSDWIQSVAFSPDGKQLASGGWDKTIKLWSIETGGVRLNFDRHGGPSPVCGSVKTDHGSCRRAAITAFGSGPRSTVGNCTSSKEMRWASTRWPCRLMEAC